MSIVFKRAENHGYIELNPVPAVTLPKSTSTEREVFTMAEVAKLVAAVPNLDRQTLIHLGFYLGARLSDSVAMTWDNVDEAKGLIMYLQKETGKIVVVPMHSQLVKPSTTSVRAMRTDHCVQCCLEKRPAENMA